MKINDRKLIEAVRQHRELYTANHSQYGDLDHKKGVWEKIGASIGQPAATCKIRWNNIRDNFRKSLRKRQNEKEYFLSTKTGVHRQYKYEHLLKFLAPAYLGHGIAKNTHEMNITYLEKHHDETNDTNDTEDNNSLQDIETASCEGDETLSAKLGVLEKRLLMENADEDSDEEVQDSGFSNAGKDDELIRNFSRTSFKMVEHFIAKENRRDNPHPVDAFLNGLAPTLKNLTPYYQNLAKTKIFAVVQQIELDMISTSSGSREVIKQEILEIEQGNSPGMSSLEQDEEQEIATRKLLE